MTEAYICDRCGECFDSLSHSEHVRFRDPRTRAHPYKHLCETCHEELKIWWNNP